MCGQESFCPSFLTSPQLLSNSSHSSIPPFLYPPSIPSPTPTQISGLLGRPAVMTLSNTILNKSHPSNPLHPSIHHPPSLHPSSYIPLFPPSLPLPSKVFTVDERDETLHRLGLLNVYDPCFVDREFKLDLRRWEHREWSKGGSVCSCVCVCVCVRVNVCVCLQSPLLYFSLYLLQ